MSNITVSAAVDTLLVKSTLGDIQAYLLAAATLTGLTVVTGGASGGLTVSGGGIGGGNAMGLIATDNTFCSAVCFFDVDTGAEHGAIGWGNQTGGGLSDLMYIETSDLNTAAGSVLNGFLHNQSSARSGNTYSHVPRMLIGTDLGDIVLTSYDPSSKTANTITITTQGLFLGGGVSAATGRMIGLDVNNGVRFHCSPSGVDQNTTLYRSFGDTFANAGGHVFTVQGLEGVQTIRFQLSNDTSYIDSDGFGATSTFWKKGAAQNITHYCYGGSLGAGIGHIFYTGGLQGSQSIRMQIADDKINITVPLFASGVAVFPPSKDTGWTANADSGDKTSVIPVTSATIQAALNVVSPGTGDAFVAIQNKVKALEAALVALKLPNA